MNRAAARSYPFQVIRKFMFNRPGEVFYIGGNDILGISQSYISRLEKRIMKRLRKEIVKYE